MVSSYALKGYYVIHQVVKIYVSKGARSSRHLCRRFQASRVEKRVQGAAAPKSQCNDVADLPLWGWARLSSQLRALP